MIIIPFLNETKNRLLGENFVSGAPGTIRTYDLQLRKLMLYPTELRVLILLTLIFDKQLRQKSVLLVTILRQHAS